MRYPPVNVTDLVRVGSDNWMVHDFDFLVGTWRIHHRRLKERLAGSDQWEEFEGTSENWQTLAGAGNVDDNVLELPAGTYRAIALRSFDPSTQRWAIWWLDSRYPHGPLDPPVVGGFSHGVGIFLANDSFEGQPILTRFIWSDISETAARWEQASSPDGGRSWEVNWIMELTRVS
jgi:hypothetical protein